MPRKALLSPVMACGSSMAVAIRSSRLMSSMSKALRMWVQPAPSRRATCGWSRSRSNCVFTASGVVVTWLSASAVAKILTRSVSIGPYGGSNEVRPAPRGSERYKKGFLGCLVPYTDKYSDESHSRRASRRRLATDGTNSFIGSKHPVEIVLKFVAVPVRAATFGCRRKCENRAAKRRRAAPTPHRDCGVTSRDEFVQLPRFCSGAAFRPHEALHRAGGTSATSPRDSRRNELLASMDARPNKKEPPGGGP